MDGALALACTDETSCGRSMGLVTNAWIGKMQGGGNPYFGGRCTTVIRSQYGSDGKRGCSEGHLPDTTRPCAGYMHDFMWYNKTLR
jgi:hypothetical protein